MLPRRAHSQTVQTAEANPPWLLPASAPIVRRGLCTLAQPCLKQAQHTPRFLFQDTTVLLIAAGRIDMDDGVSNIHVDTPETLLLVDANTSANLLKTPSSVEKRFRSIFLTLAPELLEAFFRLHTNAVESQRRTPKIRPVPLDEDLAPSLEYLLQSMGAQHVSDERFLYRAMDFLAALTERGLDFAPVTPRGFSARLRALIGEAPGQQWTAHTAGKALAVSEATLRRRLGDEQARFEDLLIDVRMHHAMMLVQTTSWSVPEIAQACGYQSRARFSERFRARFGYLPSAVR